MRSKSVDHVPFGAMRVDDKVQRELIPAWVKRLAREWRLDDVGIITLSLRDDGNYYIVDGQHRWAAALERGLSDTKALCHIYRKLDPEEQARLFLSLNANRKVSPYDLYRVGLQAGDPVCLNIRKVLRSHGLKVARNTGDGNVMCVSTLLKLCSRDEKLLDDVCALIVETWGTRPAALERVIFEGMGLISARYNGEIDKGILTTKLAKYRGGPAALAGDAKGLRDYKHSTLRRCVAEIVVDTYNKGRRAGALSPL